MASVVCPPLATTFLGIVHPDYPLQQFRGIQYATIPARFRQSHLNTSYLATTDATRHGPVAPQPDREDLVQDEFQCLNLVITRPAPVEQYPLLLPVMIWIHGYAPSGSFDDPAKFIQTSMEIHQPVIVVNVNYRLGLLGFAASEALEAANRLCGESGVGNYALHDQLNAIAWVRRYISHFGGDPSALTLFGDGAGATHIHALLLSRGNQPHTPLVHRAILQGGVLRPAAVQPVPAQTALLTRVMARVEARTVEELRRVPVELLVTQTPAFVSPTDDGCFFREDWQTHPVPMQSLIIGDCSGQSAVPGTTMAGWTTTALIRRVRAVIRGTYKAEKLLRTYGLEWSTEDEEAREVAMRIVNDAWCAWPVDQLARTAAAAEQKQKQQSGSELYRYVFDQESPFTFPTHHPVDVLHLFDNPPPPPNKKTMPIPFERSGSDTSSLSEDSFTDEYDSSDSSSSSSSDDSESESDLRYLDLSNAAYNTHRVRQALQARWLAFAHGHPPWDSSCLFVLGPEGEVGERRDCVAGRRRVGEETCRNVLESVGDEVLERLAMELVGGPRVVGPPVVGRNRV